MRQTRRTKQWNLLSSSDGIHHVDGRYSRLYHLLRVRPFARIDARPLDIQIFLRHHRRSTVDGIPRSVKDPSQHILAHRRLQHFPRKLQLGPFPIDPARAFEYLHHRAFTIDLEHLSAPERAVAELR